MKIVAVSGVDGAGKSTFIRNLKEMLDDGPDQKRVVTAWLRFNPRASMGSTSPDATVSTVDAKHKGHPLKRLALRVGLASVYTRLAVTVYRRQLAWQLSSIQSADILLADRFTLDFVADLIGGDVINQTKAAKCLKLLPTPDLSIVLTGTDEVLLDRMDPRESADLVLARRDLYLALAKQNNLQVIDTLSDDWRGIVAQQLTDKGIR